MMDDDKIAGILKEGDGDGDDVDDDDDDAPHLLLACPLKPCSLEKSIFPQVSSA